MRNSPNPLGRVVIALLLVFVCVVVGFVVVVGIGGRPSRPAASYGDLAATAEARRTASELPLASSLTPTATAVQEEAALSATLAMTQSIPLLTIANRGLSDLEWRLLGVYRNPAGSAAPVRAGVAGANSFDVYERLRSDPELAERFRFTNLGDDWDMETIQSYDMLVVDEPEGRLTEDEAAALASFQRSGRSIVLGAGRFDSLPAGVASILTRVFGAASATVEPFAAAETNPEHAIADEVKANAPRSPTGAFQLKDGDWVVRGSSGHAFVAARDADARTVIFGDSLASWQESSPELVRNALLWAGTAWLFVEPLSGVIPAQAQEVVTATLDTGGFFSGTHTAVIVIESNDPATARLETPMTLLVSGEPAAVVQPESLDFSQTFVGYSRTRKLEVKNDGVADLQATLRADDPALAFEPATLTVPPKSKRSVEVTYRPESTQLLSATITLVANDPISPTQQVTAVGEALEPPVIDLVLVDPELAPTSAFTTGNAQVLVGPTLLALPTPAVITATVEERAPITLPTATPTPEGAATPEP